MAMTTSLNVLVVAAIDFGTTFSGYGFAFPHSKDNEKNDDPIYLNKNWGQNLGCQSYKAPTTVLFGPDKKFIAFGFEAVEKYATLTENGEDKSYYFFEHFKMRLHSNHSEIRRDMPLAASNGKTLPALDVFSKSLKFLSDHLREAVKIIPTNPKLRNIKTIFLVGGFADSPLLWKAVAAAVSDRGVRVLVPEEACLAVIKGAVMFGRNPNAIQERVSARTYGVRSMTTFIEGLHPPQKKVVAHGTALATDIFNKFVGVDELVELQCRRSIDFKALRDDQRSATVYLFSTSKRDPQFTTDHGMSLCGRVQVDMPDTRGGRERVIRVTFIFGGTEIDVQAEDLTSHMRAFATIDFLTKHNP
ncbi:PREDICTED: heat shock 70 kDa protein 12B-like [Branchiostoma belcheri]|uniref:Heat shock 70 kDa protein 12B-like n=1 Tax=Branchiostoma belcheri TaxID=7741 RepID=A0A6P4YG57_BRABE|nr:PREDICTED: heat shock 70 kDa protein 12B-like [Branchiostoma belcheri]